MTAAAIVHGIETNRSSIFSGMICQPVCLRDRIAYIVPVVASAVDEQKLSIGLTYTCSMQTSNGRPRKMV